MVEDANPIVVEVDGVKFTSISRYYSGDTPKMAHLLKENNQRAIDIAAAKLSNLLPPFSIIVPVPNRCGYAKETLLLARALSRVSGVPVSDVLKGNQRQSLYDVKKSGGMLTEGDLGFKQVSPLPFYRKPVILDNVAATGLTAKAAYHALGNRGEVLTYAIDDTLYDRSKKIEQSHGMKR